MIFLDAEISANTASINFARLIVNLNSVGMPRKGSRSFFNNEWRYSLFKIIDVFANFLILSGALLFEYFSLCGKNYGIGFCQ